MLASKVRKIYIIFSEIFSLSIPISMKQEEKCEKVWLREKYNINFTMGILIFIIFSALDFIHIRLATEREKLCVDLRLRLLAFCSVIYLCLEGGSESCVKDMENLHYN